MPPPDRRHGNDEACQGEQHPPVEESPLDGGKTRATAFADPALCDYFVVTPNAGQADDVLITAAKRTAWDTDDFHLRGPHTSHLTNYSTRVKVAVSCSS
jgi:hypothetical protein